MIDKQTIEDWKQTAEAFYGAIFCGDDWVHMVALNENKLIRKIIEAIEQDQQDIKSPCDLCKYDPPSSGDGKPCCMCPAQAKGV